jgi:hypothetical protein
MSHIYITLLLSIFLSCILFCFCGFRLLLKGTDLFLFPFIDLILLLIFPSEHLNLSVLLKVESPHLHYLFDFVLLPLPVFLAFFLHLLHYDNFLRLYLLYLAFKALNPLLILLALLVHCLHLSFLSFGYCKLLFEFFGFLLVVLIDS